MNELKNIVQKYVDTFNRYDINLMLTLFDENIKFESISGSSGKNTITGKLELANVIMASQEYFSERLQSIKSWTIGEKSVAIETQIWCKLSKSLPGGAKAGEEMNIDGASFFTIKNGKIIKLVEYM